MKKSFIILMFLTSLEIFGHGHCVNKNSCTWSWRWRAHARAWSTAFPQVSQQQGCSSSSNYIATASKGCAYQRSENRGGAWRFTGWVSQNICGRGYDKSDLNIAMLPNNNYSSIDTLIENSDITTSGQANGTNFIEIRGINGFMEARTSMISSFSIKVWLPSNSEDTTITENEIVYNGKISIINGQVSLSGNFTTDFTSSFYSTTTNGEKKVVNFSNNNLRINLTIPRGRSINDFVVIGESDGTYNDALGLRKAQENTDLKIEKKSIKFDVFPNPTNSDLNVTFKANSGGITKIYIYDSNGKLVDTIFNNQINAGEEININLSDKIKSYSTGNYFILIDENNEKYLKQFIKQ